MVRPQYLPVFTSITTFVHKHLLDSVLCVHLDTQGDPPHSTVLWVPLYSWNTWWRRSSPATCIPVPPTMFLCIERFNLRSQVSHLSILSAIDPDERKGRLNIAQRLIFLRRILPSFPKRIFAPVGLAIPNRSSLSWPTRSFHARAE